MDKKGSADSAAALLWGEPSQPRRGPKPSLSLRQIAQAALDVADQHGFEAVSMQRVAEKLGFTKMSLYRYVSSKDDMIALLIDTAIGSPPDLNKFSGSWRDKLCLWAEALWDSWEERPWLPGATSEGHRIMGPNELNWVEAAVKAMDGTGFTGEEKLDTVVLLSGHIRNTQSDTIAGTFPWTPGKQLFAPIAHILSQHQDRYPALLDAMASISPSNGKGERQGREFGLHCILDGLELLLTRRST